MKRLAAVFMTMCMLLTIAGCAGKDDVGSVSSSSLPVSESQAEESSETESSEAESSEVSDEAGGIVSSGPESSEPAADTGAVRVAALKGPTAMGMIQMMDQEDYEFTLAASADEVTPLIIQGKVDIAAVPANLAAVLFSKTEGKISVIDINTLGVLYILENGEATVSSVEDLRGKTIFASGKGATPEYALNYTLTENGIDPAADVTIEYKSEHAECVAALVSTENSVAMLPQPFVTSAQMQNEGIQVVLDMTAEWEKLASAEGNEDVTLVTGVTIVRNEFLQENPEAVERFLADHEASEEFVNQSPAEAARLIEAQDILKAPVAEKAIPFCNITCVTGEDMKKQLASYLNVLAGQNIESIGGALPDDTFYYSK